MIRNPRYWLVLLPFVALFASSGVIHISFNGGRKLNKVEASWKVLFAKLVFPILTIFFVLQGLDTIISSRWKTYLKRSPNIVSISSHAEAPSIIFRSDLEIHADDVLPLQNFLSKRGVSTISYVPRANKINLRGPTSSVTIKDPSVLAAITKNQQSKLLTRPSFQAIQFLRQKTPLSATVLSFRPADMYYSERRMISCFDPRLLPFYRENNVSQAWQYLRELGIDYLHVPEYYLPVIYNSIMSDLITRSDLIKLVFSAEGTQIYKLQQTNNKTKGDAYDFTPGKLPWTRLSSPTHAKQLLGFMKKSYPTAIMNSAGLSEAGPPLFQHYWSTTWISGLGTWWEPLALEINVPVRGACEYLLEMGLEGHAFVRVWLMQLDVSGQYKRRDLIGELVLGPLYPERRFIRRFVTYSDASYIRVGVEHKGSSRIRIIQAKLTQIIERNPK